MFLKVRVRRHASSVANSVVNDEFRLFDNVTELRYAQRPDVTTADLFQKLSKTISTMHPSKPDVVIVEARDDLEGAVEFHYNVATWTDGKSGKKYALLFDTVLFVMNDAGATIETLKG